MNTKICGKCKDEKDLICFSKDKHKKSGYKSWCKSCCKSYMDDNKELCKKLNAEHYKNNKEKYTENHKKWRENNPNFFKEYDQNRKESKKIYKQNYVDQNRDKVNERVKKYYHRNKDVIRPKVNERNRKRRKEDLQYRLRLNIRCRVKAAITKGFKCGKAVDLLGCSIPEFKTYIESKFLPTMTWDNYGDYWHLDHILPCDSFDMTDIDHVKKCFHYTNHQPLFAVTQVIEGITYIGNINKGSKLLDSITIDS